MPFVPHLLRCPITKASSDRQPVHAPQVRNVLHPIPNAGRDPDPDPDPNPDQDYEDEQNLESERAIPRAANLNAADNLTTYLYSATSSFVYRKVAIHVPYNLSRGSAVVRGEQVDGSSVGDSPILMPWEDRSVYSARQYLIDQFHEKPELQALAQKLCEKHRITLGTLIHEGPPHVVWMDPEIESTWREYGNRQTYPILKALFAHQTFVILYNKEGCGIINGSFERDYFDRLIEIEAISKTAIVAPGGLVVAAPHRFYLSVILLLSAISLAALSIILDDRPSFIERFESAIFIMGFILLTIPGAFSLLTAEPNLLRNAVRGKMTLTKQSQVTKYFNLSRRDYAMLVTRTRGSKLVSADIGCFLTGEERGTHMGDEPVVECEDLAPFGVICGQSVYYRTNWQKVYISNRLGANQTHLTNEEPKVKYWCAGVRHDTWVGFLT